MFFKRKHENSSNKNSSEELNASLKTGFDENCYIAHSDYMPYNTCDDYDTSRFESYPYFNETAQTIVSICADSLGKRYRVNFVSKPSNDSLIIYPNCLIDPPDSVQRVATRLLNNDVVCKLAHEICELFFNGSIDYRLIYREHGLIINIGKTKISYSNNVFTSSSSYLREDERVYQDKFMQIKYNELGMSNFQNFDTLLGFAVALIKRMMENSKAFIDKSINLRSIFQANAVSYSDGSTYYHYKYGISVLFTMPGLVKEDDQSVFRQW